MSWLRCYENLGSFDRGSNPTGGMSFLQVALQSSSELLRWLRRISRMSGFHQVSPLSGRSVLWPSEWRTLRLYYSCIGPVQRVIWPVRKESCIALKVPEEGIELQLHSASEPRALSTRPTLPPFIKITFPLQTKANWRCWAPAPCSQTNTSRRRTTPRSRMSSSNSSHPRRGLQATNWN